MKTVTPITTQAVRTKIADTLAIPPTELTDNTLLTDLSVDSLALIEIAIELEEDYDVAFEQSDLKGLRTVGDVAALVEARLEPT
jgi:acyl carrier protein